MDTVFFIIVLVFIALTAISDWFQTRTIHILMETSKLQNERITILHNRITLLRAELSALKDPL